MINVPAIRYKFEYGLLKFLNMRNSKVKNYQKEGLKRFLRQHHFENHDCGKEIVFPTDRIIAAVDADFHASMQRHGGNAVGVHVAPQSPQTEKPFIMGAGIPVDGQHLQKAAHLLRFQPEPSANVVLVLLPQIAIKRRNGPQCQRIHKHPKRHIAILQHIV